jgi:hypothetical protein
MGPTKHDEESTMEMESKCHCIQQHQQLHQNNEGLEGLPIPPFDLDANLCNELTGNQSYVHTLLKGYQRSSTSFTQKCIIEFWCHHSSSYDDVLLLLQTVLLVMESAKAPPGDSNGQKNGHYVPKIHSQKCLQQQDKDHIQHAWCNYLESKLTPMDNEDYAFTVHEEEDQGTAQQLEQTINQSLPNTVSTLCPWSKQHYCVVEQIQKTKSRIWGISKRSTMPGHHCMDSDKRMTTQLSLKHQLTEMDF